LANNQKENCCYESALDQVFPLQPVKNEIPQERRRSVRPITAILWAAFASTVQNNTQKRNGCQVVKNYGCPDTPIIPTVISMLQNLVATPRVCITRFCIYIYSPTNNKFFIENHLKEFYQAMSKKAQ
jgi:hypothetical protein